ncbi:hypothetical protein V8C37DRAFT_418672 [Trichoderma ceciliae]
MAYTFLNHPTTPVKDAIALDGLQDDLVPSGFVESRIRELNIISSKDRPKTQSSPYVVNAGEGGELCSPACQRTRFEVSASPPVGHSYPGLRINDNHSDDNGVAWEVSSMSAHMFNATPNLRASRSSISLGLQSPSRAPSRFRSLRRSNGSSANQADDAKLNFKSTGRSQVNNPRASLSTIQTAQPALDSSTKEQQDALDMFDMYGVSRPKADLVHEQDQQKSKQKAWRQGVTHSRSLADLSEPISEEHRPNHWLSHSKSRDSVAGRPKESRMRHTEIERQARQQFRHERRQRLEKSYSDMINPEQYSDCPTCHTNSNPARHSICCVARLSPSRRQMVDQAKNLSNEEDTYKGTSQDSFESINKKNEAEMDAMLATSLSSDYTTAEPSLMQQAERDMLTEDRANTVMPPSEDSHHHAAWPKIVMRTSPRRRVHDLADDTITQAQQAPRNLHNLEQDGFWTRSEGIHTAQRTTVHQTRGNDNHGAPKWEGVELERIVSTDLGRSPASEQSKTVSMTPKASRRISVSRGCSSASEHQQEFEYDEQTKGKGAYQPQSLPQENTSSPVRKADNSSPRTPNRRDRETLGSRDSLKKATNAANSPEQKADSSNFSTWKQQLMKISGTPISRNSSPKKIYSPLAPESLQYSRQSPVAYSHAEASSSPTTRHEIETEEQGSKGYEQMESTDYGTDSNRGEDAIKESKMASNIPKDDSEIPISHHICEWRSRYLGLSAAFDKLKNELDIALEHQASPGAAEQESENASRQHQYNDYGIEGLTIIVHRRCKEDLVLNTDLREEEFAHIGE